VLGIIGSYNPISIGINVVPIPDRYITHFDADVFAYGRVFIGATGTCAKGPDADIEINQCFKNLRHVNGL
jgi:hypothetical protein